jgi:ABC-type lipoprotein export system ATPase subunit
MNDPRGSIWRKWDLHLHTPASEDYQDKSVTNEAIIQKLKDSNIAAVAITDHFVMDVDRIVDLQRIAGEDITVFPGIELRSELGGDESIHYIGIFPDRLDVQKLRDIWDELKAKRELTPTRIAERGGIDAIICDLDETYKIINSLGGIVTIHSGSKTNSIENIANSEYFKMIQKKEIVANSVDIMELGKAADEKVHKEIIFKSIGFSLPLIICSDNHNINDYTLKAPCWIKADTTFKGLKQIIIEPEDRIFIGDEPEIFNRVRDNKTKYISTVHFSGSLPNEKWFADVNSVPFNPELVAIIGNKGSGKSALSDTIGLLGSSRKQPYFSFLHKDKFCIPNDNKAEHFTAAMKWNDNAPPIMKRLCDAIDFGTEVETVTYIPQNYLENICSDEIEGRQFNYELRAVIFSHVPEAERLGCTSLDDLITVITNEKKAAIEIVKSTIHKLNIDIVRLEEKLHPNYKQEIQNQCKLKMAEREAIAKEKPIEVPKPDATDPEREKEIKIASEEISNKQEEIGKYEQEIETLRTEKINITKRINDANTLLLKLDNMQQQYDTFKTECELLCSGLGITFDNIAKLELDKTSIISIRTTAKNKLSDATTKLLENNENGPVYKLKQAGAELEKLKANLDQPNKNYQRYLKELQEWGKKCATIEGVGEIPEDGTIRYYETALRDIDEIIPTKLKELKAKRSEGIKGIYNKLDELKRDKEQHYASAKDFMKSAPFANSDRFLLDFNVSIECKGFLEKFFDCIAQNKKGSFYGSEEGKGRLRAILDIADFNTSGGLMDFLTTIENNLIEDKRDEAKGNDRRVIDQLRIKKDTEMISFYDYLYCLDYLTPEYNLRWSGKRLSQLSPGERGMVLLIFYLFIDKQDIPLVIDQPEENLDNESVYKVLMFCIKAAKKRRQIIIVTHNPNLAVVCDAEQIIYSEINKQDGNKITYTCGAIENPAINKKLIDVLEGTRPAFDNRDSKYYVLS